MQQRTGRVIALVAALWLVAATTACAKDSETSSTAGTAGGPSATSGSSGEFANLSGQLQGSGATFPKPFYEEVKAQLEKKAKNFKVEYSGGGSGKGKQDLQDQVVDFAGSDSLVKADDVPKFKGGRFLYFPTVAAPITVSYNLKGVNQLRLSPDTLARIFQGEITNWNDPAIAADNSDVDLPDRPITVARRADGSGTTSNFTRYLKSAAPGTWKLDAGDTVQWPEGTQAGNGNAGVAQTVKDTEGAIGYVDFSDAKATGLKFAAIRNRSGKFVEPTLEAASAALEGSEIKDDLTYDPLNAPGDAVYPITAPTWILVYAKQPDSEKLEAIRGFLTFVLTEAQEFAADVDYARLPRTLQQRALAQLDQITT